MKWFLDWLVLSLEGVEFHADAESRAETREELLYQIDWLMAIFNSWRLQVLDTA